MKKSVRETLKLAVEQLFVRIHGNLFDKIYANDKGDFKVTQLAYDPTNESHQILIKLLKEKIGYEPVATEQDMFYSIMRVYVEGKERERIKQEEDAILYKKNVTDRFNKPD